MKFLKAIGRATNARAAPSAEPMPGASKVTGLMLRNEGLPPAFAEGNYDLELRAQDATTLYAAIYGDDRVIKKSPSKVWLASSLCQQIHFSLDEYRFWMREMGEPVRLHRKCWEHFYIAQALFDRDLLNPGKRGLAFAVGSEPLPALFAKLGCTIVATDQPHDSASAEHWTAGNQHAKGLAQLARPGVCRADEFAERVSFAPVDMNSIPADLQDFDFCWSACSFEHLGSLEHGIRFVENAMNVLKPGGVAVHTTEFNLSSNAQTLESEYLSIYRQRDIQDLIDRLRKAGHRVEPMDFSIGKGFVENLIDLPPYGIDPSIRIRLQDYDCTSIGIIVTKAS